MVLPWNTTTLQVTNNGFISNNPAVPNWYHKEYAYPQKIGNFEAKRKREKNVLPQKEKKINKRNRILFLNTCIKKFWLLKT